MTIVHKFDGQARRRGKCGGSRAVHYDVRISRRQVTMWFGVDVAKFISRHTYGYTGEEMLRRRKSKSENIPMARQLRRVVVHRKEMTEYRQMQ
mgnify:CR=1 FL=1